MIVESKQEDEILLNVTSEEDVVESMDDNITVDRKEDDKNEIDEITNVLTSLKLSKMKSVGGKRTSPVSKPEMKKNTWYPCTLCNFHSNIESARDWHIQNVHYNAAPCPLSSNRFNDLQSLKEHINVNHKENSVQTEKMITSKICAFFQKERGCKKKDNCDFSHDISTGDIKIIKINKLCRNGPRCHWKPRCKYIHPEDGEVVPPREERGRRTNNNENRGQGFGGVDLSRAPPGYLVGTLVGMRSQGGQQSLPDIRNMTEFPNMGEPRYLTIRIN